MKSNRIWYQDGLRDGVPIALGYFAVAFTLGIAARNAGFSAFQAAVSSLLNHASAGEYAVISLVAAGAGYWEMAVMALVSNARYLLMSCSLSQKLAPDAPLVHRALVGFGITDEIFGISVARPGYLNPWYTYGAMAVARVFAVASADPHIAPKKQETTGIAAAIPPFTLWSRRSPSSISTFALPRFSTHCPPTTHRGIANIAKEFKV